MNSFVQESGLSASELVSTAICLINVGFRLLERGSGGCNYQVGAKICPTGGLGSP